MSGNWFHDSFKISQPIILLQRNGVIPIRTPITFKVRFFQSFKLKRILHTDYLARVVAFQNGYMIPLSRIQVCHSSQAVTPVRTLFATQSHPNPVATSSGLYPSHHISENIELPSIIHTNISHPLSSNVTPTQTPTASILTQVVWGN